MSLRQTAAVAAALQDGTNGRARLSAGVAANLFGVRLSEIAARSRRKARVARARQVAIYLTHVGFGEPEAEVSSAFCRHRSTIRHSCARIEDCRDDAGFDWSLDLLEAVLWAYATTFLATHPETAA